MGLEGVETVKVVDLVVAICPRRNPSMRKGMTRVQKSHGFRMIRYCLTTAAGHCDARLMLVLGHPTPLVMRILFQPKLSHGTSTKYKDPPSMSPLVFSGSTHDGGYIFVPTPGMPTPPLVHVESTMVTLSPPPTKRLYKLSRYRLRTLSRWKVCGDCKALLRTFPIAGPDMVCNSSTLLIFLSY